MLINSWNPVIFVLSLWIKKKSCSCIKWWKTPKNKKKKIKRSWLTLHTQKKNSCDVKLNWVKSLVMIRITRGLKNTKIYWHKNTSIGFDFIKWKKEHTKKSFKIGRKKKKKSLTFEDELNSSIFIEFTCLHRSRLHWIFGYHGLRRWTSCRKTLWNQVEDFHKVLLSTSH